MELRWDYNSCNTFQTHTRPTEFRNLERRSDARDNPTLDKSERPKSPRPSEYLPPPIKRGIQPPNPPLHRRGDRTPHAYIRVSLASPTKGTSEVLPPSRSLSRASRWNASMKISTGVPPFLTVDATQVASRRNQGRIDYLSSMTTSRAPTLARLRLASSTSFEHVGQTSKVTPAYTNHRSGTSRYHLRPPEPNATPYPQPPPELHQEKKPPR